MFKSLVFKDKLGFNYGPLDGLSLGTFTSSFVLGALAEALAWITFPLMGSFL